MLITLKPVLMAQCDIIYAFSVFIRIYRKKVMKNFYFMNSQYILLTIQSLNNIDALYLKEIQYIKYMSN